MHIWNKARNGAIIQQAQPEVVDGNKGVMKEWTLIQQAQAKITYGIGG